MDNREESFEDETLVEKKFEETVKTEIEKKVSDGKKVFFLHPSVKLTNLILTRLRTMEYEVYTLDDYKILKNILLKNPNSICFINPEGQLHVKGWFNFIKSFSEDENFKSVKIGLLTEKLKQKDEDEFKKNLTLAAGFISEQKDPDEILRDIVKAIDKLEAKGNRQYVRASCDQDKTSEVFWVSGDMMYKMKILNISAVGMAVRIPPAYLGTIRPNQTLMNAQIMLNSRRMTVHLFVLAVKQHNNNTVAVLMFGRETDKDTMIHIREFVASMLQKQVLDSVYTMKADKTEYNPQPPLTLVLEEKKPKGKKQGTEKKSPSQT